MLRIAGFPAPSVGELRPGTALPARCPERHIQHDQTFCVGLRPITITTTREANDWWRQLEQYLRCQGAAQSTHVWPPNHALDHGGAGIHHERALKIAAELEITEEYLSARLDEPSWITSRDIRLLDKRDRPINGRAPCPRGCRVKGRPAHAVLRRNCPRRSKLLALVIEERKRRHELKRYWDFVKTQGVVCCGTMRDCPLR